MFVVEEVLEVLGATAHLLEALLYLDREERTTSDVQEKLDSDNCLWIAASFISVNLAC